MYTMKQACELTGMNYEALKFYCNEGLVPNVKRDRANRRIFDEYDIAWINSLTCLKKCGMGLKEMKEFLTLCLQGQSSVPERRTILENKRKDLLLAMHELQSSIDYIDRKQAFYDDVIAGRTKYYSNLIPGEDQNG